MFHVEQIIKKVPNGCTKPFQAMLKEGQREIYAYIKLKNNEQGVLALINELISYNLALVLDIPMPLSGIAIIDDATNFGEFEIDRSNFGHCFYSKAIDPATILNRQIMKYVSNNDSYEKIILFDHLVYNKDRNKGNLLIYLGANDKIIYAIDHTHVFKNETIWDRYCFKQGMSQNDYTDTQILERNKYDYFFTSKKITYNSLLEQAEIFKERISETLFDKIFMKIPKDWNANTEDLEELKTYLLYRRDKLDDICLLISNYIENKVRR